MFEVKSARSKVKINTSQQYTKQKNTMLLLNMIRKYKQISRIMLSELTGLSATTVSILMDDLIANGLVTEIGTTDSISRGRRPIMLEINPKGGYFVLVEIINTGIISSLYDLCSEIVDRNKYRLEEGMKKDTAIDYIRQLLVKNNIPADSLLGINVIYPGLVDRAAKKMIYSAVVPTKALFEETEIENLHVAFPNAVFMLNNYASISVYAEYALQDYKFVRSIVSVDIFERVGAGVIFVNDKSEKIYDMPIELGHVMVDKNGPLCRCGNRGCLEMLVGICSIFERIEQETGIILDYVDEINHKQNIEAMKRVRREAKNGNPNIIKILDECAEWIALALTNMNNIIDPGYIFICGPIKYLGEEFIKIMNEKMVRMNLKHTDFPEIIKLSSLDEEDRLKGGIAMLIDEVFALNIE